MIDAETAFELVVPGNRWNDVAVPFAKLYVERDGALTLLGVIDVAEQDDAPAGPVKVRGNCA